MSYVALATDYDGTLANGGHVGKEQLAALERLKSSGRSLILVTGRLLNDLLAVFPGVELFDRVVAENGALVYRPNSKEEVLLCDSPNGEFVAKLQRLRVPVSIGRAIVATVEPYQSTALEVIHELGLELHIIFNKGAVMVLPSGVNKATGLKRALDELGIAPAKVVAIGDAENDHAMLAACGLAVAVASAVSTLRQRADLVTANENGAGVTELIQRMIANHLPQRSC